MKFHVLQYASLVPSLNVCDSFVWVSGVLNASFQQIESHSVDTWDVDSNCRIVYDR